MTRTSSTASRSGRRPSTRFEGCCPTASVSNVGIYGTGQSYEQLILRMRAHPLPEARRYAEMMLDELRKVIPSFLQRLDRPERGGVWAAYLASTRRETEAVVERLWPDARDRRNGDEPLVRLVDHDPEGEDKVLAAMCFSSSTLDDDELLRRVEKLERRRAPRDRPRVRRRPDEPQAPSGSGARAHELPLRDRLRLRGVPGPPTSPDAHRRMAAATRRTSATRCPSRSSKRASRIGSTIRWPDRRSSTATCDRSSPNALPYALTLAHRLRYVLRHERPRGDAPDRAAERYPGPPGLPAHRSGDAPADRRAGRPPDPRGRDDLRRLTASRTWSVSRPSDESSRRRSGLRSGGPNDEVRTATQLRTVLRRGSRKLNASENSL